MWPLCNIVQNSHLLICLICLAEKKQLKIFNMCLFSPSLRIFVKASLEVNDTQQQQHTNVYHDIAPTRNKIVTAQFECYQKIMKDNTDHRQGTFLKSELKSNLFLSLFLFLVMLQ